MIDCIAYGVCRLDGLLDDTFHVYIELYCRFFRDARMVLCTFPHNKHILMPIII